MAETQIYDEDRDVFSIIDGDRIVRHLRVYDESIPPYVAAPPLNETDTRSGRPEYSTDRRFHNGNPAWPPTPPTADTPSSEERERAIMEADERRDRESREGRDNRPGGPHNPKAADVPNLQRSDEPAPDAQRHGAERVLEDSRRMSDKTTPSGEVKVPEGRPAAEHPKAEQRPAPTQHPAPKPDRR